MKKLILSIIIISAIASTGKGQTKLDDFGRIVLNTHLYDNIEVPEYAKKMLITKLDQLASENGMGGSAQNPRFIITANIQTGTKDIIAGPPQMIALNLYINFFIADGIDGIVYSTSTIEKKGVGTNENKAYIEALKIINPKDKQIQAFIEEGKNKIIAYYNSKCDFIIKSAETNAFQKKYEEALLILNTIPEVCAECYNKAQEKSKEVYTQYIDNKCAEDLTKANAAWASFDETTAIGFLSGIFPDSKCYKEALALVKEIKDHKCSESLGKAKGAWANLDAKLAAQYLSQVSADSKCAEEANKLASEISSKLKADAKAEWDLAYEKYNRDQVLTEDKVYHQFSLDNREMDFKEKYGLELEKIKIKAGRDVGVAYGRNQPRNVTYKKLW